MAEDFNSTFQRKKEHIELCLTDKVSFKDKTNGFEHYDFNIMQLPKLKRIKLILLQHFLRKR